jgi:glycerol-3-phosphate acyltransferase PlsY
VLGAVPFGYVLGRLRGIDVRAYGSGNIGATNVMRSSGRTIGLLTFLLDGLKGAAGPLAARGLGLDPLWEALAGLAAVLGHCFSVYLRLRGGKGVATLVGVFTVLDPVATAVAGAVFGVSLLAFRYVALSSLLLCLTLMVATGSYWGIGDPRTVVAAAATLLVAVRHRDNWRRMLEGTEGRAFTGEGKER